MHEERALVALDTVPPAELRPEFRAGVARLLQVGAEARPPNGAAFCRKRRRTSMWRR
jgi:hypothetical protein